MVIGLDGATWKILKPLLRKGKLPYLKKLINEGQSGILESTIPPMTGPAWASFQTGVTPGDHGIFDFVDYRPGSWGKNLVSPADVSLKRFWHVLEEEKKPFCLLNMPLTYPPPKTKHGLIISSFFTPPGARFVSDSKIQKELEKLGYQIEIEFEEHGQDFNDKEAIYQEALKIAKKRFEAAQLLAKKRKWDYFFVLFRTSDLVQHFFWNSPKTEKYYLILDGYLKQLHLLFKKLYHDQVNLIILSDHGFHQAATYQFSINTWLQKFMGEGRSPHSRWQEARGLYQKLKRWGISKENFSFLRSLAKKGLKQERQALFEFRKRSAIWAFRFGIFIDKEKLEGDYEKVRDQLIKQLSELKYKGKPVFRFVKKREKVYQGQKLNQCPDILLMGNEDFNIDATSFNPDLFLKRTDFHLKGEHFVDRKGIFLACGPAFPYRKKAVNYKIWQLAPLMLKMMRVRIESPQRKQTSKKAVSRSDKKKIMKRLRALGYF